MKKVTLKLDAHSVLVWKEFLDFTLQNMREFSYNPKKLSDRLLIASLTELHERIYAAYNPYAHQYKIKITHSMAIGFVLHCLLCKAFIAKNEALTINNIIGKIDQQTV